MAAADPRIQRINALIEEIRRELAHLEPSLGRWLYSRCPEYEIWWAIKKRCLNPKTPNFRDYGGRGITIDDRWKNDFVAFYLEIGPRPSPKHSVDRINNDLGYIPGNVRWATRTEQSRNRRSNRPIEIDGIVRPLIEWAELYSINEATARCRLERGWGADEAFKTPAKHGTWQWHPMFKRKKTNGG